LNTVPIIRNAGTVFFLPLLEDSFLCGVCGFGAADWVEEAPAAGAAGSCLAAKITGFRRLKREMKMNVGIR
jgi:hypothetical protein